MTDAIADPKLNPMRRYADETPTYTPQRIEHYRGNPFIEALPPIIGDRQGVKEMLKRDIAPPVEVRTWSSGERMHVVAASLAQYMCPLDRDITFFQDLDTVLRGGYVGRNPDKNTFGWNVPLDGETLKQAAHRLAPSLKPLGSVNCRAVIGHSGLGKSKMVEEALAHYPQTIVHSNRRGPLATIVQVVWLKVEIPIDGSLRGFCYAILHAFDEVLHTSYRQEFGNRGTVDTMTSAIAMLATNHGLGVLVIDEIANLRQAPVGGEEKMMNFFKQLADVTRVPVVAIGTEVATNVLGGDFQNARRNGVSHILKPLSKDEYLIFCRGLLDGVVLRDFERTDRPLIKNFITALWDYTIGIHGLVIRLVELTQQYALQRERENLDVELLHAAYHANFTLLDPYIKHMRKYGIRAVGSSQDVRTPEVSEATPPQKDPPQAPSPKRSAKTQKRRTLDPSDPAYALLTPGLPATQVLQALKEQGCFEKRDEKTSAK